MISPSRDGEMVAPAITFAQKKWIFNRWDRFMVPKPFARVIIRFGEVIDFPAGLTGEAFQQKR